MNIDNSARLDAFFQILEEREKVYYRAQERYVEGLIALENIAKSKRERYTESLRTNPFIDHGNNVKEIDYIVDNDKNMSPFIEQEQEQEQEQVTFVTKQETSDDDPFDINTTTLKRHILDILALCKNPISTLQIMKVMQKQGRQFSISSPEKSIYGQLHRYRKEGVVDRNENGDWFIIR